MGHKGDVDEDAELVRIRDTVRQWRIEALRQGKPLRLPVMPFLLRNIWTGALLFFAFLTFSTFFISTVFHVCLSLIQRVVYTNRGLGHDFHQSCWNMLGGGDVGAVHDHHGGRTCASISSAC